MCTSGGWIKVWRLYSMRLIWKIIITCLLIHCSNYNEEKKREQEKYFLCVIISTDKVNDSKTAVGNTLGCTFQFPKAFRKDDSSLPFQ
jgi:hypothetical protein